MLARDVNSQPTQYRTWIVEGTPDFEALHYKGPKSGPLPFVDVTAYAIQDDNVIADFNLPLPQIWFDPDHITEQFDYPTHKVLPEQISDTHLAILDGYIYLFGGKVSDKIWRASVNNPADFVDTGARLPTKLYAGQLAIIQGRIYIFGGNSGNFEFDEGLGAVDTIFSASVDDPLTWTNHGSLLPRKLMNSTLGMFDESIYLFGGQEINDASDVIFKSTVGDPLTWIDSGGRLPSKFYGSSLLEVDGVLYLFGGQDFPDAPINTIHKALTSSPLDWIAWATLPYEMSFAQAFTFGAAVDGYADNPDGYAYLIGQGPGAPYVDTRILRAPLSSLSQWLDVTTAVPAGITHSQIASVVDRLWLYGGDGQSAIFASWQDLKYDFYDPKVVLYGTATRRVLNNTSNSINPFRAFGFPWWKTDFRFNATQIIEGMATCSASWQAQFAAAGEIDGSSTVTLQTSNIVVHLHAECDGYSVATGTLGNYNPPHATIHGTSSVTADLQQMRLWAINYYTPGTLYQLDLNTLAIISSTPMPAGTGRTIDMAQLDGYLWILTQSPAHIVQVNPSTGAIVSSTALANGGVFRLNSDGKRYLYASVNTSTVSAYKFDTQTLTYTQPYTITGTPSTYGVVVDPGTGKLFQADGAYYAPSPPNPINTPGGQVWRISPNFASITPISIYDNTNYYLQSFTMLAAAGSIWASCDNSIFTPGVENNAVKRIDPVTETVTATIPATSAIGFTFNITDLKYNAKYNLVYVAYDYYGYPYTRIDQIDAGTNAITNVTATQPEGYSVVSIATYGDALYTGEDYSGHVTYYALPGNTVSAQQVIDVGGITMVYLTF